MRPQVRGGDNDKLCFSAVSDRQMEKMGPKNKMITVSLGLEST